MRRLSYMARARQLRAYDAGGLILQPTADFRAEVERTSAAIDELLGDISHSTVPAVQRDLAFTGNYGAFVGRWTAFRHSDGDMPSMGLDTADQLHAFENEYRTWRAEFVRRGGAASGPNLPAAAPPGSTLTGIAAVASSAALVGAVGLAAWYFLVRKQAA